jgi:hypothetical protein
VKCSLCEIELEDKGFVLTYVALGASYTATVHIDCLSDLIGKDHARKVRMLAFGSGWHQAGLPGDFATKR